MKVKNWIIALTGAAFVAACSEPEVILPGKRENLRGGESGPVQVEKPWRQAWPGLIIRCELDLLVGSRGR